MQARLIAVVALVTAIVMAVFLVARRSSRAPEARGGAATTQPSANGAAADRSVATRQLDDTHAARSADRAAGGPPSSRGAPQGTRSPEPIGGPTNGPSAEVANGEAGLDADAVLEFDAIQASPEEREKLSANSRETAGRIRELGIRRAETRMSQQDFRRELRAIVEDSHARDAEVIGTDRAEVLRRARIDSGKRTLHDLIDQAKSTFDE